MKIKSYFSLLLFTILFFSSSCKEGGEDTTQLALFFLFFYDDEVPADIYFELGFPGSENSVNNDSFSGNASDYTVTIGSQTAAGLSFTDPTTLQFTMPLLPGVNENATVEMVILENGQSFMKKTVRYRTLPNIPISQPHGFSNMISARDQSNFYTFTVGSTGDHIFNTIGYFITDLDIYYKTDANSPSIPIAQSSKMDTEFKKINLSAGSYILEIRYVSGRRTRNYVQIANGLISAVHTTNEIMTQYRCYDFLSGGSTSSNHSCYDQNNAVPDRTRTGRCTYPTSTGIVTRSYYIDSNSFGFDVGYAEGTCTLPGFGSYNVEDAIFQDY